MIGSSDFIEYPELLAVMALLVGWGFIGVGLVAWGYRPENRLGTLMTATGFAFFVSMAGVSDLPVVFLIGTVFGSLFMATAVHLLLAAPSGIVWVAGVALDERFAAEGGETETIGLTAVMRE